VPTTALLNDIRGTVYGEL